MPKQKGGKPIGSGTYGCVLEPSVPCDGWPSVPPAGTVSKLFYDDTEAYAELAELQKIEAIDPEHRFTVAVVGSGVCDIRRSSFKPSDRLQDCKELDPNKATLKQIVMKNGGISLDQLDTKRLNFEHLFEACHSLFYGLARLHEHQVVHLDMTTRNIVYDGHIVRMIDFGLSTTFQKMWSVREHRFIFRGRFYHFYPPEIYAFGYLIKQAEQRIVPKQKDLFAHLLKATEKDSDLLGYLNPYYRDDLDLFVYDLLQETEGMDVPALERYFTKFMNIDIYGVGIALAIVYMDTLQHTDSGPSLTYVKYFLRELTQMHPSKRIHPVDALKLHDSYFNIQPRALLAPITSLSRTPSQSKSKSKSKTKSKTKSKSKPT